MKVERITASTFNLRPFAFDFNFIDQRGTRFIGHRSAFIITFPAAPVQRVGARAWLVRLLKHLDPHPIGKLSRNEDTFPVSSGVRLELSLRVFL